MTTQSLRAPVSLQSLNQTGEVPQEPSSNS